MFCPHAFTVPSDRRAYAAFCAVEIWTTPESPETVVGVNRIVEVPSPTMPSSLLPHALTDPSVRRAYPAVDPPAMAATPDRFGIAVGVALFVFVPLPSWPRLFKPQLSTVPFDNSTSVLAYEIEATSTTSETFGTVNGVVRFVCVPSPSCPHPLSPHTLSVRSDITTKTLLYPATSLVAPELITLTGAVRYVVVPSPICPEELSPHAHTSPAVVSAYPLTLPMPICFTPDKPGTIFHTS